VCIGAGALILLINEAAKYFANRSEDSGTSRSETAAKTT